jgi:hypothetical protein
MQHRLLPVFFSSFALLGAAFGCSATGDPNGFGDAGSGGSGSTSSSTTGGGGDALTTTGIGGGFAGSGGATTGSGGSGEIAEVFGQSAENLYRLDPITKAVDVIGPFQGGCFPVIDLAVDKDSNLFVSTYDGLYAVDRTTAMCTLVANGAYPNSLSFVPAGTVDPDVEALVGYDGDQYVRIDTSSGSVSTIGALTGGFASSGDIVSVKDGKTLLTVKGQGCDGNDCLLEVDPSTGDLVQNWGKLPYTDVYGLAFWAGTAYGFDQDGALFEVTFANDVMATAPIPIPNPPPNLYFWGAGSTTSAPPDPIPE